MRSASLAPNMYSPQLQDHRQQQMTINHPATAAALIRQQPPMAPPVSPPILPRPPPTPLHGGGAAAVGAPGSSVAIRKPILYYSNHCQNSRIVIETLLKYDIRSKFACVCVDTKRELVPPFVKTVPTVFLVHERQLLRDNLLSDYISQFIVKKEREFDSVEPVEGNSSMAESFSWVDGDKERQEDNHFGSRFVPVDYTQHFDSIEEASSSSGGKNSTEKDMEDAFELMRMQREADMAAQMSQLRRA